MYGCWEPRIAELSGMITPPPAAKIKIQFPSGHIETMLFIEIKTLEYDSTVTILIIGYL